MELIPGKSMKQAIAAIDAAKDKDALFPKEIVFDWLAQYADLIAYIHSKKIIHRDTHFGNAMVVDGKVWLLDFGLAKHIPDGVADPSKETSHVEHFWPGTLFAPEAVSGKNYSFNADVFFLAVNFTEFS